ncbi:MAG: hypothetical protein Q4C21_03075 [Oscillospiraceae bacterium]|nr:hypothetical protein [Oscillospiraceae bacterium]
MIHIAKPTKQQLLWQDMELGVIIRYCMEIYNPDFKEYKTAKVSTFADLYFMPIKKKFTEATASAIKE